MMVQANLRHVGEPTNNQGEVLRDVIAACLSGGGECTTLFSQPHLRVLRQPHVQAHASLRQTRTKESTHHAPHGDSSVGFAPVVEPINAYVRPMVIFNPIRTRGGGWDAGPPNTRPATKSLVREKKVKMFSGDPQTLPFE